MSRNTLTVKEELIIEQLKFPEQDIAGVAKALGVTEGSVRLTLYRMRRRYRESRDFVNQWEAWRRTNTNLRKYLYTKDV